MKNLFKGLGASIGYIFIYIVITILVVFAGTIAYGIIAGISAFKTNYSLVLSSTASTVTYPIL